MPHLRLALVIFVITAALLQTPIPDAVPAASGPRVNTSLGTLQGFADNDAEYFLGVPFASPPVGELRWQPPGEMDPWEGVLDATAYGPACAAAEFPGSPRSESEDCLFLNIFRRAGISDNDRLPVYVFIHGGGFVNGSASQYDASAIASMNNIITVSVNYRLGVLGFLAHPDLTAEGEGSSGNYGLMDQQAALRWIQSHISSFGGDKANVTLGGESAGGASVCSHLTSPASSGLFHQAMMQSAFCWSTSLDAAEASGQEIVASLGCEEVDVVACLRSLPVANLIDVPIPGLMPPVFGTDILPEDPDTVIAEGRAHSVPVFIGWNRDEGRVFGLGYLGMRENGYEETVLAQFGDRADEFKALYPWPTNGFAAFTGVYVLGGAVSDQFACDSLEMADNFSAIAPVVYVYVFSHQYGPGLIPRLLPPSYNWGAGHAAELAYLFPSFDAGVPLASGFDPDEQLLAHQMKLQWGQFVATGSPNADSLIPWMPYSETGTVMVLQAGNNSVTTDGEVLRDRHNCAFWDTVDNPPTWGPPTDLPVSNGIEHQAD